MYKIVYSEFLETERRILIRLVFQRKELIMDDQKIKRINELYRKSKAEGLTEAEKKEQKLLRAEYIEAVRRNLRGQLNNIDIEEKDGTVINLGEKFGSKKAN